MTQAPITWIHLIDTAWKLQSAAESKTGSPLDSRSIELMFGPAVAEALIRYHGDTVARMTPTVEIIEEYYLAAGGEKSNTSVLNHIAEADALAEKFATVSGEANVAVSPRMAARAQAISYLAHTLPPVARQQFQESFLWDDVRRRKIFNDDEIGAWNALELQLGMGILASIMHVKHVVPDVTPEEFAIALIRKYGVPLEIDATEVYACHWCGTAPCSCGGGKSPARRVTYEDCARHLHRGPLDTQKGMYFPYAWANTARAGVAYGPLRALIEAAVEKGAVLVDQGSLAALDRRFGPLFLPQQRHFAEVIDRYGRGKEAARKATLSELADAVHWQFLYAPGLLDHVSGIEAALSYVSEYVGDDGVQ